MATGKTRLSEEDIESIRACGGIGGEYDQIPEEIAILGTGPSLRCLPKANKWETWGCNGACWDAECDRVFMMDGMAPLRQHHKEFARYMEHVRVPVYLPEADPTIPASISFGSGSGAWANIFKTFGIPWSGGTIGYMIAFAVYRGVKKIHFFGCDLYVKGFNDNEYAEQIPAMNLWTGIAIGRGVQCYFPAEMVLAMPLRYGQHREIGAPVASDGTFVDSKGQKWIEYERYQAATEERDGALTISIGCERPAGTHIGILPPGASRETLGLRTTEDAKMREAIARGVW